MNDSGKQFKFEIRAGRHFKFSGVYVVIAVIYKLVNNHTNKKLVSIFLH